MTANIIAGLSFVVSAGAFAIAWVYGHHSKESAARSAKASEDSAEDARKVRKAELEREHREYAPKPEDLVFEWETDRQRGKRSQFLTFKLPRTYRVFGDVINDTGSRSNLSGAAGAAFEAGLVHRFFVSDDIGKAPKAVELRFFPPADGDPGETWSCPCERDHVADRHDKKGHWVVQEIVPPRSDPRVRFVQ